MSAGYGWILPMEFSNGIPRIDPNITGQNLKQSAVKRQNSLVCGHCAQTKNEKDVFFGGKK